MNATLQCFSQIQDLVMNFKNNQQVYNTIVKYKQMSKDCLTESFKTLIDNLWPLNYNSNHSKNGSNFYYAPYDFKKKISVMNPLFKGAQANDAKDLVNFIIMTMHEELNIGQKQNNMNMNLQAYQTNEQMMLNCFMNIFYTENKSIISDIFYGMTHTLTKCSNCPFYKHNFEAYFFLIFPLEEVRKYKIEELSNRNILLNQNMMMINQNMNNFNMDQNMMMNYNQMQIEYNNNIAKIPLLQNNLLTIEDCFDYNQKIENFIGENAMYCDICKMQLPSTFQTKLYNAPEVLILILNRGQGIQFKIKLEFYLQINLINYLENQNQGYIYDLIGVVTHMGDSSASGHFIASCKSYKNNNWYQYNDDIVSPITDFNSQVLNYAMPYILFYKKKH
jgi:ubiquitin C-terminal hydrolase